MQNPLMGEWRGVKKETRKNTTAAKKQELEPESESESETETKLEQMPALLSQFWFCSC